MSTITSTSLSTRNSFLRLSVIGGIITGLLHIIAQVGIVYGLIFKSPLISSLQYVASGALGNAAFEGGLATALLGLVLEFIITTIIAGVFIFRLTEFRSCVAMLLLARSYMDLVFSSL